MIDTTERKHFSIKPIMSMPDIIFGNNTYQPAC